MSTEFEIQLNRFSNAYPGIDYIDADYLLLCRSGCYSELAKRKIMYLKNFGCYEQISNIYANWCENGTEKGFGNFALVDLPFYAVVNGLVACAKSQNKETSSWAKFFGDKYIGTIESAIKKLEEDDDSNVAAIDFLRAL